MARSTEEIIDTMDQEQAEQSDLSGLTSQSQTSIFKLWKYIVAQCQNILEQLWDAKQTEMENTMAYGAPSSTAWIRSKAFEFQYDATTPQLIVLNTDPTAPNYMVPAYEVVDEDKRIITRCCVSNAAGIITVTLAKNEPPEKLTAPELAAIQGYYTNTGDGTNQAVGFGFGGQNISCYTDDPDILYLVATISYLGGYAATIQDACILAIETYISELGQNPVIRINTMIDRLQAVPGFVDIHIDDMEGRITGTAIGTGTDMVVAGDWVANTYTASAGYMISETTPANTLADKLTFTAV